MIFRLAVTEVVAVAVAVGFKNIKNCDFTLLNSQEILRWHLMSWSCYPATRIMSISPLIIMNIPKIGLFLTTSFFL